MKRFVRNLLLSAAVASTALAGIPAAQAQDHHPRMSPETEKLIGIGFLGLAAGALVGALAAESNNAQHYERNPRPRPSQDRGYYPPPPADAGYHGYYQETGPRYHDRGGPRGHVRAYEAWSPEWFRWCQNRYRSINPNTGTFTTYGGEQRFCVVQ